MRRAAPLIVTTLLSIAACTTGTESDESPAEPDSPPTALTCWSASPGEGAQLLFEDATAELGLVESLTGMFAHAAVWGDVNEDGWVDLFVGTYADRDRDSYLFRGADGPAPDRLLLGGSAGFETAVLDEVRSRSSGGLAVDLDDDGDLDLVVTRNIKDQHEGNLTPTEIFENRDGELVAIQGESIPPALGARSVAALDYDDDGLLDLFITEDRWTGGSSVLLRNVGDLEFEDVTAEAGLPEDAHGLGVAVADFDGDTLPDIFVAGSNRIFLLGNDARFEEGDNEVFAWDFFGDEDDVAGVDVADVNRDGHLDIVLGHHFNSTVDDGLEVPVRLYLNDGSASFTDVTEAAGLTPLPTKAPHVAVVDLDNDGWPEIVTSASANGGAAIFRHLGLEDGIPHFAAPTGLGSDHYWVAAPTADYDRDGRLDIFLVEPRPEFPSLLLRNSSGSGNWLEISVEPGNGIGWTVEVSHDGEVIGIRPISVTQGYSAGVEAIAHFGLGDLDSVEVRLVPPHRGDVVVIEDVAANQHIRWPAGC